MPEVRLIDANAAADKIMRETENHADDLGMRRDTRRGNHAENDSAARSGAIHRRETADKRARAEDAIQSQSRCKAYLTLKKTEAIK